jgi:hypothetical protein
LDVEEILDQYHFTGTHRLHQASRSGGQQQSSYSDIAQHRDEGPDFVYLTFVVVLTATNEDTRTARDDASLQFSLVSRHAGSTQASDALE